MMKNTIHSAFEHMNDEELTAHIYKLFAEYKTAFVPIWKRMDNNSLFYQCDDWEAMGEYVNTKSDEIFDPKPVTPTTFSTIENLKADIMQEFPEAIFKARTEEDYGTAEVMTQVYRTILDGCDYRESFLECMHDMLVNVFCVHETVWDVDASDGMGDVVVRRWPSRNFMCDPFMENIQDSRVCFKFTRVDLLWAKQHYPEYAEKFNVDAETLMDKRSNIGEGDVDQNSVAENPACVLIECWYREYSSATKKYSIHVAKVCGGVLVEHSKDSSPKGIYAHGQYPFSILSMFPVSGSPIGFCIVDVMKAQQAYTNKLEQILYRNILAASRPKFAYTEGMIQEEQLLDWSNPSIAVGGTVNNLTTFVTPPLPMYVPNTIREMHENMKENSGQNQFGRGETAKGVTAATAIMALQRASGKRSGLSIDKIYQWYKKSTRQAVEIIREFYSSDRYFMITDDEGNRVQSSINGEYIVGYRNGKRVPINFALDINPQAQNTYSSLVYNEFANRLMEAKVIPASVGISMMDIKDKWKIVKAVKEYETQQEQIQQMQQMITQQQQQMQEMAAALNRAQKDGAAKDEQIAALDDYTKMVAQEMPQSADGPAPPELNIEGIAQPQQTA